MNTKGNIQSSASSDPIQELNGRIIAFLTKYKKERNHSLKYWLKDLFTPKKHHTADGEVEDRKDTVSEVITALNNNTNVESCLALITNVGKYIETIQDPHSRLKRYLSGVQYAIVQFLKDHNPEETIITAALEATNQSLNGRIIQFFEIYEVERENRGFFKALFTGKVLAKIKDTLYPNQKINDLAYINLIKNRLTKCNNFSDYFSMIKLFMQILEQKSLFNSDGQLLNVIERSLSEIVDYLCRFGEIKNFTPEQAELFERAKQFLSLEHASAKNNLALGNEEIEQLKNALPTEREKKEDKFVKIFKLAVMHGFYEQSLYTKCAATGNFTQTPAVISWIQSAAISAIPFPVPSVILRTLVPAVVNPLAEKLVNAIYAHVTNGQEGVIAASRVIGPGEEANTAKAIAEQLGDRYEWQIKQCKREQDVLTLAKCAVERMNDFMSTGKTQVTLTDGIEEKTEKIVDSVRTSDKRGDSIAHKDDTNMLWGKSWNAGDVLSAPAVRVIEGPSTPSNNSSKNPSSEEEPLLVTRYTYREIKKGSQPFSLGIILVPHHLVNFKNYISVPTIQANIAKKNEIGKDEKKHLRAERLERSLLTPLTMFWDQKQANPMGKVVATPPPSSTPIRSTSA
jgi:hypothetical protein